MNLFEQIEKFANLCEFLKLSFIKKLPNGKYRVLSEKGKNLGTYDTKSEAKKRLRQVEFFKHVKGSKDIDLSNLKAITLSSVMRQLTKNFNDDKVIKFLKVFNENYKDDSKEALEKTIQDLKEEYNFK